MSQHAIARCPQWQDLDEAGRKEFWASLALRHCRGIGPRTQAAPEGRAAEIVCLLQEGPLHVDDLAERLRVRPAELSALLLQLELSGRIRRLPGARYEATS